MTLKLLSQHYLEFLSLKGGFRDSSRSTLVKIPHCWKSRVTAQFSCVFVSLPVVPYANLGSMNVICWSLVLPYKSLAKSENNGRILFYACIRIGKANTINHRYFKKAVYWLQRI